MLTSSQSLSKLHSSLLERLVTLKTWVAKKSIYNDKDDDNDKYGGCGNNNNLYDNDNDGGDVQGDDDDDDPCLRRSSIPTQRCGNLFSYLLYGS